MPDGQDGLLGIAKVATMLDVDEKTVRNMVKQGRFPDPVEIDTGGNGRKAKRWFRSEVLRYLDERRIERAVRQRLPKTGNSG